jgi:UDP-N-acetyl-2-amino-2-deoxyglucuronate dehydrogenase
MKTWNIGIIGAGMIADFHAKAIQHIPNAKLIGFCGTNLAKSKALAEKYACRSFESQQELLQCDDIEIVTIATPSGAHMEPTLEAARQGKHVICEKPLEISLDRIDKMIEAHHKSGTRLGGIFNFRYNDAVQVFKKAMDSGRFGTLTYAAVHVPWWRSDEYYKSSWRGTWKLDGGGALMNQSIHMIDMLQYLMGPVKSLQAYAATLAHSIEVEDTAAAILLFRNKALGMIYGSTASFPGQFRRIEITGNKGTAVMVENSITTWKFIDESQEDKDILKMYGEIEGGGGTSDPGAIPFQPHAKNIAAFIHAVENYQPFAIDGPEARKSVEIVTAIYRSANKKEMVYFAD